MPNYKRLKALIRQLNTTQEGRSILDDLRSIFILPGETRQYPTTGKINLSQLNLDLSVLRKGRLGQLMPEQKKILQNIVNNTQIRKIDTLMRRLNRSTIGKHALSVLSESGTLPLELTTFVGQVAKNLPRMQNIPTWRLPQPELRPPARQRPPIPSRRRRSQPPPLTRQPTPPTRQPVQQQTIVGGYLRDMPGVPRNIEDIFQDLPSNVRRGIRNRALQLTENNNLPINFNLSNVLRQEGYLPDLPDDELNRTIQFAETQSRISQPQPTRQPSPVRQPTPPVKQQPTQQTVPQRQMAIEGYLRDMPGVPRNINDIFKDLPRNIRQNIGIRARLLTETNNLPINFNLSTVLRQEGYLPDLSDDELNRTIQFAEMQQVSGGETREQPQVSAKERVQPANLPAEPLRVTGYRRDFPGIPENYDELLLQVPQNILNPILRRAKNVSKRTGINESVYVSEFLRDAGYFPDLPRKPIQPKQVPKKPVQPVGQPVKPAQPKQVPKKPVQPVWQPVKPAQPTQPKQVPKKPVQPVKQPEKTQPKQLRVTGYMRDFPGVPENYNALTGQIPNNILLPILRRATELSSQNGFVQAVNASNLLREAGYFPPLSQEQIAAQTQQVQAPPPPANITFTPQEIRQGQEINRIFGLQQPQQPQQQQPIVQPPAPPANIAFTPEEVRQGQVINRIFQQQVPRGQESSLGPVGTIAAGALLGNLVSRLGPNDLRSFIQGGRRGLQTLLGALRTATNVPLRTLGTLGTLGGLAAFLYGTDAGRRVREGATNLYRRVVGQEQQQVQRPVLPGRVPVPQQYPRRGMGMPIQTPYGIYEPPLLEQATYYQQGTTLPGVLRPLATTTAPTAPTVPEPTTDEMMQVMNEGERTGNPLSPEQERYVLDRFFTGSMVEQSPQNLRNLPRSEREKYRRFKEAKRIGPSTQRSDQHPEGYQYENPSVGANIGKKVSEEEARRIAGHEATRQARETEEEIYIREAGEPERSQQVRNFIRNQTQRQSVLQGIGQYWPEMLGTGATLAGLAFGMPQLGPTVYGGSRILRNISSAQQPSTGQPGQPPSGGEPGQPGQPGQPPTGGTPGVVQGTPGSEAQIFRIPRYTPTQQMAQQQLMQQGVRGLGAGVPFTYWPTMQRAVREFYGTTVPTLAERFTAMGPGAQTTRAFGRTLGEAGSDLQARLAQQRGQYLLQQQGLLQNLTAQGMMPQFQSYVVPGTEAQPPVISPLRQAAGNIAAQAGVYGLQRLIDYLGG